MTYALVQVRKSFQNPFQEQVDFFRNKLNLPSDKYTAIRKDAHDRAFMVAGAMKADLLNDFRGAIDKAIADGTSLYEFRQDFDRIVAKHGWTGWKGEGSVKGVAWRTNIIYQTNISTSYAAGRYAQLTDPDLLAVRPYWKYIHSDGVLHARPLHVSWNGTVLPYNHPWWQTHFPPCGYLCHCRITAVRKNEFKNEPAPDDGFYEKTINGVVQRIPNGVDVGFDYLKGANTTKSFAKLIEEKLINYPDAIAKALQADITGVTGSAPVSAALTGGVTTPATRTALEAVDSVHNTRVLPKIPIKLADTTAQGAYQVDGAQAVSITLSPNAAHKELTLTHEIGHFLDHHALGETGIFASVAHPLLDEWRVAVDNSAAIMALQGLRGTAKAEPLDYLLRREEQWARCYAQYIALKSGNEILLNQLAARRNAKTTLSRYAQWQDDDFAPIMAAMDKLFSHLGWRSQ